MDVGRDHLSRAAICLISVRIKLRTDQIYDLRGVHFEVSQTDTPQNEVFHEEKSVRDDGNFGFRHLQHRICP